MEQESRIKEEQKHAGCFPLRCFVYFVAIVCVLACILFQFLTLALMKKRLAVVETTLSYSEITRDRERSWSEI